MSARTLALLAVSSGLALGTVVAIGLRAQHGTFTYAIDDASIHLTLARNLAHGTFGLVPGQYESASSAPLWEILLAPVLRVAPGAFWAPLLINVAALGWILVSFSRLPLLHRLLRRPLGVLAVAILPIGLGLVPLVLTGMEHTLHVAVFVQLLVWLDARVRGPVSRHVTVGWYGVLAAGSLLRFETMFIAFGLFAALVFVPPVRQWRPAVGTVVAACVPVAVFAAVNRSFGQYALPNSVVAKTAVGGGSIIPKPGQMLTRLTDDPLLLTLVLIAVGLLVYRLARNASGDGRLLTAPLVAVLVTTVLHLAFAEVGWFDRYQAYLVVGLTFAILVATADLVVSARFGFELAAVVVVLLSMLRTNLLLSTPGAMYDIYKGQYQTGLFLGQSYAGQGVAVGDIGYVSWFHEGPIVDVAGLGSFDVLEARKDHRFGTDFTLQEFAENHVDVLVVYSIYFTPDSMLPGWSAGGKWCFTSPRVVLSDSCIVFYAPDGPQLDRLRHELAWFEPRLPDGVTAVPV